MRKIQAVLCFCFAVLSLPLLFAPDAVAQERQSTALGGDRLFLAFAEDAAFVSAQWWEGQFEYADINPLDVTLIRGVVAFQPVKQLEVGGRVGFGSTDAPSPPDGSGATDLDIWGKWDLGVAQGPTDFTVGALATVPTGDDSAGLGFDAFNLEVFGALRHRLTTATVSGHVGVRANGDGRIRGVDINGKTSAIIGGAVLYPVSDVVNLVGEINLETERFRGADSDTRILGGINWRLFERGILRGAVAAGLTDGAPDVQLLVGYAYTF